MTDKITRYYRCGGRRQRLPESNVEAAGKLARAADLVSQAFDVYRDAELLTGSEWMRRAEDARDLADRLAMLYRDLLTDSKRKAGEL